VARHQDQQSPDTACLPAEEDDHGNHQLAHSHRTAPAGPDSTPSGGFSLWQSAAGSQVLSVRSYHRPPDAVLRGGERQQRRVNSLQLALAVASFSAHHPRIQDFDDSATARGNHVRRCIEIKPGCDDHASIEFRNPSTSTGMCGRQRQLLGGVGRKPPGHRRPKMRRTPLDHPHRQTRIARGGERALS
jgi:hypothetical protein